MGVIFPEKQWAVTSFSESGLKRLEPVRVMVVDDQAAFRRVAQTLIVSTPGFLVVGEASSGADASSRADQLEPELVLMDVYMPGIDGFEAARRLLEARPDCVVVLVSLEDHDADEALVASSGAVAFVRKQDLTPTVLRDLWTAHGTRPLVEG